MWVLSGSPPSTPFLVGGDDDDHRQVAAVGVCFRINPFEVEAPTLLSTPCDWRRRGWGVAGVKIWSLFSLALLGDFCDLFNFLLHVRWMVVAGGKYLA